MNTLGAAASGRAARSALSDFGGTAYAGFGYGGALAQKFLGMDARYVYTRNAGWVDMAHFAMYAGQAWRSRNAGFAPSTAERLAMSAGEFQESHDTRYFPGSAYSYEDLPSDALGAYFGAYVFDPLSSRTLAEQMEDFLFRYVPTDPRNAPNWSSLPWQGTSGANQVKNRTTSPLFTTPVPPITPTP